MYIYIYIYMIKHNYSIIINKSRKSLWKILVMESAIFWRYMPREAKIGVKVRALTIMDLTLMSQPGFPEVKLPREAKIRVKVRAHTVMDLVLRCRCVLRRGRSVAEGTPLSAPISLLIDRNYTITVLVLWSM